MYNMSEIKSEPELMNEISKLYDSQAELNYLETLNNNELGILEEYSEFIIKKIKAAFYLGVTSR